MYTRYFIKTGTRLKMSSLKSTYFEGETKKNTNLMRIKIFNNGSYKITQSHKTQHMTSNGKFYTVAHFKRYIFKHNCTSSTNIYNQKIHKMDKCILISALLRETIYWNTNSQCRYLIIFLVNNVFG